MNLSNLCTASIHFYRRFHHVETTNTLLLYLGIFSLFLTLFDFFLEGDLYGGMLAVAWGLLFIFPGIKDKVVAAGDVSRTGIIQGLLIVLVIAGGLIKIINRITLTWRLPFKYFFLDHSRPDLKLLQTRLD